MKAYDLGKVGVKDEAGQFERADAAANRRLILETAARLFDKHDIAEVTMADIAAEAGIGKGTLYRRYNNKGELALALMDEQMSDFQNETLAQLREYAEQNRTNLYQLGYFLDALVYFTDAHLPYLCVVQSTGLPLAEREHSLPYHWQYRTVSGLLQRAIQAGELSPELDVTYTADALLAPLRVDLFRLQREVRGLSLQRISSGLRTLVEALNSL